MSLEAFVACRSSSMPQFLLFLTTLWHDSIAYDARDERKAGRPATGGVLSGLRMTWQEAFSSRDEAIAWTRESGPLDRKFTNMVV